MIAQSQEEIVEELARRGRGEPSEVTVPEAAAEILVTEGVLTKVPVPGAHHAVYRPAIPEAKP